MVSSYTANLAAFLTIERMDTPISSASELANSPHLSYGILKGGSTHEFFEAASKSDSILNLMKTHIEEPIGADEPTRLVTTTARGIELVRKFNGQYAFLLESSQNEYTAGQKPCDTMRVGKNLDSKGYGIALPKNSFLYADFNLAILKLSEQGVLRKMQNEWWVERSVCPKDNGGGGTTELDLSTVAGLFYILIFGLILSVLMAMFEHQMFERKRRKANLKPDNPDVSRSRSRRNSLNSIARNQSDIADISGNYTILPAITAGSRKSNFRRNRTIDGSNFVGRARAKSLSQSTRRDVRRQSISKTRLIGNDKF